MRTPRPERTGATTTDALRELGREVGHEALVLDPGGREQAREPRRGDASRRDAPGAGRRARDRGQISVASHASAS